VIRLLAQAIGTANKAESPSPSAARWRAKWPDALLLGLGLRNFSMHPAHLLSVKQRVLTSEVSPRRSR
jgi:phosphotransferase system enzyme I (PtsI)